MTNFAIKLARLPLLIPAALVVLAVRIMGRFGIVIRFGNFLSGRIGHLVGNTEVYLCERDAGQHPYTDIWTHYGTPASAQIDKMLRRILRIWPYRITALIIVINKMFPGWERHDIGSKHLDRDPENLLAKYPPHLEFTPLERARAEKTLHGWGLSADSQWVCLMVRDAAYLPFLPYHSYRDSDIDTYADAAIALAERGYHVFRMGVKMAKPFNVKHERIHDFAMNGMYSDLMSTYLGAYCAFTISTSTGWDAIPQAFRRPMCYVNFAPYEYFPTWLPNSLLIWKHHMRATLTRIKGRLVNGAWEAYTDSGKGEAQGSMIALTDDELTEQDWKRMGISEIAESGAGVLMRSEQIAKAGIKLQDNTPAEITAVAMEMADMIEGRKRPEEQQEFWDAYPRSNADTGNPLHGEIKLRIGRDFLQEYLDAERKADSGGDTGKGRIETGAVQEHHDVPRKAAHPVGY